MYQSSNEYLDDTSVCSENLCPRYYYVGKQYRRKKKNEKAQLLQILQLNKLLAILINTQNQCKAKTYQTIILQHIQLISKQPTN